MFVRGLLSTGVGRLIIMVSSLIVDMVLSRILSPADYGVVAVATVFVVLVDGLASGGLEPAVIQQKKLDVSETMGLLLFSLGLSCLGGLGLFFIGYALEWFYGGLIYRQVAVGLAIGVVLRGLCAVPRGWMLRSQRFLAVNVASAVAAVVSGAVGVIVAMNGFGVFALVAQAACLGLVNLIMLLIQSRLPLAAKPTFTCVRSVWHFASRQLGFTLINFFSRNSDNLLVGKFMGTGAVGSYNKAYQLLLYPNQIFLGVVNPVLQPILAPHQDNPQVVRDVYEKLFHLLALVGMPLSAFLALSSEQVIFCLYGSQWGAAVLPFTILATTVWIQMTLSTTGSVYQARNRPDLLLANGLVSFVLLVGSIVIGVILGTLVSLATCLAVAFLCNWVASYAIFARFVLETRLTELLRLVVKPMIIAAGVVAVLLPLQYFWHPANPWLQLFGHVGAAAVVSVVLAVLTGEAIFILKTASRKDRTVTEGREYGEDES